MGATHQVVAANVPVDRNFASVVLLCNAQGTNGSTVLTDSSSYARTSTAFNQAQISTSGPIFGVSSALFDGTGDKWTFPNSADFDFGTGAFTIEGFAIANVNNAQKRLCGTRSVATTTQGFDLYTSATGKLTFTGYLNDVAPYNLAGATTIPTGVVFHWAFTFDGTTLRVFLSGSLDGSQTPTPGIGAAPGAFNVGSTPVEGGTRDWDGKQAGLRITKGVCRYTANFTPDYTPFPIVK